MIGNAAYENAPALVNPVNDAADMCATLSKLGFKTLCHINVRNRAEFDARVKDYVEQLGPNRPILSRLPLYMARRSGVVASTGIGPGSQLSELKLA